MGAHCFSQLDDAASCETRTRHRRARFFTARHALNPILLDAPVVSADGQRASVFLTPLSAAIERRMPLIMAVSSGVLLAAGYASQSIGSAKPLADLFVMLAFAVAAIPALQSVWDSLRSFRIDIDALMLLGAGLAAIIGQPAEGALLLFLFALSGALEEFALNRTQAAIVSLHNLVPSEALVLIDAQIHRTTLNRVAVGSRVLIRPGDRVPLDGTVVEGTSAVNESAITGESMPRDKRVGDPVYAGTTNLNGRLVMEVIRKSTDTTLARILRLVTEAKHRRAGVQRLIDRIGPTYSTSVILFSIAFGLAAHFGFGIAGKDAVRRAIAVLIVCSPCALIIATPVAYLAAIGACARRGILIKGGVYLETFARAKTVVFDKTGTLTTGQVRLTRVISHDGIGEDEALRSAGAIESSSSHPLAAAIMRHLDERKLQPHAITELKNVAGEGTGGMAAGRAVWIGRPNLASTRILPDHQARFAETLAEVQPCGQATSALVIDGIPALFVFEDSLRPDAGPALRRLRAAGITHMEMLTGDHESAARALADQLDLDGYRADLLPEQKLTVTEELRRQHGELVMVGDGVNDAPALAAADVGIAIGSIGADVALEAADIVLMNDNLSAVAWLRDHATRTARIVRQNLFLAIGVIVGLCGFAMAGTVPLPIAVIGHEGSTVLVALNALRLLRGPSQARSFPSQQSS